MRVLGIAGSVRRDSHNRQLLLAAAAALPPGAELETWDRLAELPHFSEDLEAGPGPAVVRELRDAVAAADAVVIATPEYNAGVPGVLKNALDWLSRPFDAHPLRDKPVAVIGASTGLFGALWAQAEVRRVAAHLGARVIERELPVGQAHAAFAEHGGLHDAELAAALRDLLAELIAEVRIPAREAA
jgi:chromate reductase, NAD(P)H dehydrogenase (quinone)